MEPYGGSVSYLEPHFNGGDWSPRISFSHNFACIQRIPSPTKKSPLHDSDFEFSRSVGTDLLSADELFCNGKLRPLKLTSHESGAREWKASQRREEVHMMESSVKKGAHSARDGNSPASKEEYPISACKDDPISRRERNGDIPREIESNAGEAKSLTSREAPNYVCRRPEKVEIGKKAVDLRSPTSREEYLSSVCRREEKLEKDGKAGKSGSPTSRKEVISVRKLELGENAGKSRSPTRRKELIPACKLELSSKAGKLASPISRDVMSAWKNVKDLELEGKAGETKVPTGREDSLSTCRGIRKWEKGGTPVTWREELQWAKRNEEDEHADWHLRRFSKNPRSASMIVEGSCNLGNRSCVSLNNSRCPSRCPSPSRSFSRPSTTPTSPSASGSFSGFSSSSFSSSSSKYRSKIKDFFKLKKQTVPKEDTLAPPESSPISTCRLPISPRSFFAFFKSKENTNAGSKSSSFMPKLPQEVGEHVCNSSINKNLDISCLTLPNSAKPPPNPSFPLHFAPSSTPTAAASTSSIDETTQHSAERAIRSKVRTQRSHSFSHSHEKEVGKEGPTMLVIDEGLWEEGNSNRSNIALNLQTNGPSKEGTQRIKKLDRGNMMMVGSKGGPVRPRGLERPLPYTSSVRVTPVLNVPSCITPSLRKTKSSTKPKAFIFENLFARREKALVPPTFNSSEG